MVSSTGSCTTPHRIEMPASRLILAGCRCRKTLESTPRARLRGVWSCLTRRTLFQTSVFDGALTVAFNSSTARACTALASASTAASLLSLGGPSPPSLPLCPLVSGMFGSSDPDDCTGVVKLARFAFGPAVDVAQVDYNLSLGIQFDMGSVHGARRRTLEVDAFGVVAAAVARALELVLARLPVRRAAQVGADGRDDEDTLGIAYHPDAALILKFRIHPETEIRGVANAELDLGFVERARIEEAQKHQEVEAQRAQPCRHHKPPPAPDHLAWVRVFAFGEYGSERLRQGRFRPRPSRRGADGLYRRIRHLVPMSGIVPDLVPPNCTHQLLLEVSDFIPNAAN